MTDSELALVGDIGATNARFSLLLPDGSMTRARVVASADFTDITDAIVDYLAGEAAASRPTRGVLAIAAAMVGDRVTMTNHPWSFSIEALRSRLGLKRLRVINDFAANALSIPLLDRADIVQVGPGSSSVQAPIGVIGPGTGLGVGALLSVDGRALPLESEGGHVTMAAANAREAAVLELMRQRLDHVSAERVLSGPGLVNLYNALCELAKVPAAPFTPAQITDPRMGEEDPQAREATSMFCAMLGTIAGNLALTLGARGGIYVAGGIVPKLGSTFVGSEFRRRFEAKGRFRSFLKDIPTYVIMRPVPALLGASQLLRQQ
jgi:glucokinase